MMNAIQGVMMPNVETLVSEVSRIDSANPVQRKFAGERTGEKSLASQSMFDQMNEQDKEKLQEELDKHNDKFAYTGKFLKFKYDEEAAMTYVEVVDSVSNEVIVSLPPEFLIDLSVKMKKILGLYIDEKL